MPKKEIKTAHGSYLVIRVAGDLQLYIGEIIQENPLRLKITEDGPYSKLTTDDFIIDEVKSKLIQGSEKDQQQLLSDMSKQNKPLVSGLISLGISDGKIRQILPIDH